MSKHENGKMYEFSLGDEIFNSMAIFLVCGMIFGFLLNIMMVLMGNPGNMTLWIIICMIIFGGIGIGYAFKLRKFNKEFGIRKDNDYSIDKIKDYFGSPVNILEDKDCSYYTFHEEFMGIFARTHTFTTKKKRVVIKHELTSFKTNKKN